MSKLTDTLRSEARWRPTIWGDARPLLIEAANEIDRLRAFYDAWRLTSKSGSALTMSTAAIRFSEAVRAIEAADKDAMA